VTVPGSKSQTNRALVIAALAAAQGSGVSTINGALRSRDTDLMIGALQRLGLTVTETGTELTIARAIARTPETGRSEIRIECGLAGTVLRFVPPLAALGTRTVIFDGDEQAKKRPITPLLDGLRSLGVDVDGTGLPFAVLGSGGVKGGTIRIDASASSQFVSGLLLSGAAFDEGLVVEHIGSTVPSAPHIAMTVTMLRQAGVIVDDSIPNRWQIQSGRIAARHWAIEPDLSNSVPFMAAAIVTGGTVRIAGWPDRSVQPAASITDILQMLGASLHHSESAMQVSGPRSYRGFDVDLNEVGELTPSIAALAALAVPGSISRLSGIAHLRGHETDRLAALRTEINALGGNCTETPDGLVITATPMQAGTWHSYADHRMATAGAIIGLRVPGIIVEDIATTAKTLPDFPALWAGMLTDAGQET
jgi:3-phosphoshikimate 1-carboxyvinyltransferase